MPRLTSRLLLVTVAGLTTCLAGAAEPAPGPAKRRHWAFQPLAAAPETGTVDSFVSEKLGKRGLTMSPEADPRTLIRRLTLDLHGLPPAPDEVETFVRESAANSSQSIVRLIDRLLASPRYGERWAQHWLDVVRYADTHGFEVNTERPNAWPYRDYVIRSFNDDVPYDRFIREQLAGDALGEDAATGFMVTAAVLLPGQIGADDVSKRLARQDALSEIVSGVSQTFLGLSIGCARCHDHKFDPVSQRDYYSVQAFFAGVEYGDRPVRSADLETRLKEADTKRPRLAEIEALLSRFEPLAVIGATLPGQPNAAPGPPPRPAVNPRRTVERFAPITAQRLRFTINSCTSLEPCLDELEVLTSGSSPRNVALAAAGTKASASSTLPDSPIHRLEHLNDGRYGNSRSWISSESGRGRVELEFARPETIERVVWSRDREGKFTDRLATDYRVEIAEASGGWRVVACSQDRRTYQPDNKSPAHLSLAGLSPDEAKEAARLMEEKKQLETKIAELTAIPMVYGGTFSKPDETRLLYRGDPEQPRESTPPAVPAALGSMTLPSDSGEQARRLALASWIASPDNPLTARVMVNRLWQGHFGTGLVETASDFGLSGTPPSHHELLDWLAAEFIRSGWSVKHVHRLILNSAAYRQSNRIVPAAQAADADCRLLWRFPSRRMEAEAIRDSMLTVSGRLNFKMGGPGFDLFGTRGGLTGFPAVESFSGEGLRRMIYAHKVRMERDAVFGAFDCPDAGQSTDRRRQSTTPVQALNLFNSRFTLDEAEAFAARVIKEAGTDPASQVRCAWQLAFGRNPGADELHSAESAVQEHGLPMLCRVIFNSNEFLFLP